MSHADTQTLLILRKMRNFNVDFSKIFWGLCPQILILGTLRASAPRVVSPLTKILATRLTTTNYYDNKNNYYYV